MKKKFKSLIFALLGVMIVGMIGMVGCTNKSTDMPNEPMSPEKNMTKAEEYKKMLDEKIKTYMGGVKLGAKYDFSDVTDENKQKVYEEYEKYYTNLDTELSNLRNELSTKVIKGDSAVDQINKTIIDNIDNLKMKISSAKSDLDANSSNLMNMSKDEFVKTMDGIESNLYEARVKLQNSIESAQKNL